MPDSTFLVGQRYERLAERALVRRGYHIIGRNLRYGGVELDRVAWHEGVLCFVEVRARADTRLGDPMVTIDHRKRARLVRGATAYLLRHFAGAPPPVRFDVVGVVFGGAVPRVTVVPGAFDATGC
jgi:putative endonuclease